MRSLTAQLDPRPEAAEQVVVDVLASAAAAFGVDSEARSRLLADPSPKSGSTRSATGGWGSFTVERWVGGAELTMSAPGVVSAHDVVADRLPGPISRARELAEGRGYRCSVADVGNLGCERDADGYQLRLHVEPGAGDRLARVGLEVLSTRPGVLRAWNTEFAAILGDLGGTAAPVSDWLVANPRAGGADVFLGSVELNYWVDLDAYVKEVSGAVRTPEH